MHYATVYPEGDDRRRFHAESFLALILVVIWVRLITLWPNPLNPRRVIIERPGWPWQTFLHD